MNLSKISKKQHLLDRLNEIASSLEQLTDDRLPGEDPFSKTRRYERRFPTLAHELPKLIQGYDRSVESALVILGYLEQHFPVNAALHKAILALAMEKDDSKLTGRPSDRQNTGP